MQCPYCKEEIKEGAKKCQVCGEFLGLRGKLKNFTGPLAGLLSILIPLGSLGLAYLEIQARSVAVAEKKVAVAEKNMAQANEEIAMAEKELTVEMLAKEVSRESALDKLKPHLNSEEYGQIENKKYIEAEQKFKERIEIDPKNEEAKRGLIYLKVLKKIR